LLFISSAHSLVFISRPPPDDPVLLHCFSTSTATCSPRPNYEDGGIQWLGHGVPVGGQTRYSPCDWTKPRRWTKEMGSWSLNLIFHNSPWIRFLID
jgi:hypothetical protein